jgi:hypothetical protein
MPITGQLLPGVKVFTPYSVANSLRFNDGSSDSLSRSFGTPSSTTTWTISFWVKKCTNGSALNLCSQGVGTSNEDRIRFDSSDRLEWTIYKSAVKGKLVTNRLFRDNSAWYNVICRYDSTNGTAGDRMKIFINGSEETSFSTDTNPDQNETSNFNTSATNYVGSVGSGEFFDGYMAEVVFTDGQALDQTSFGEFDEDSPTIWKPIDVSGLTFGTNGFYLDFENSGSLGADVSGNSNNFTVNNLTSIDQSTDTCTNNFATLNPLVPTSSATFSEGNLKITGSSSSAYSNRSQSTFAVESGKWYFEVEADAVGGSNPTIGIGRSDRSASDNPTGSNAGDICIRLDNEKYDEGSASASYFSSSISNGNIIGVALDMDNGKIWFSLQGTFVGTVGSSGEAATFTVGNGITITPTLRPMDGTLICNFGSPPYAISSGNSDGNGYGNFEYSVPSGYYSLNSKNLAEFG